MALGQYQKKKVDGRPLVYSNFVVMTSSLRLAAMLISSRAYTCNQQHTQISSNSLTIARRSRRTYEHKNYYMAEHIDIPRYNVLLNLT